MGYSVNIYYVNDPINNPNNKELICIMYHYNSKCIPYINVPALYFKNKSYDAIKGEIRIGTFALLMLYNLINIMKARAYNDDNTKNIYYTMISHMTDMKTYYLNKTNKTIFDESLFQEFVLRCVGHMLTPQMEKAERIEKKIKSGKKYSWNYNPEIDKNRENLTKYVFKNSSGNAISNEKNKKINMESITNDDIDNMTDEDGDEA